MNDWRDHARRVVYQARLEGKTLGMEGAELRKFVSDRYPFGERAMHPYKIWLDEMARQLGPSKQQGAAYEKKRAEHDKAVGQLNLFKGNGGTT